MRSRAAAAVVLVAVLLAGSCRDIPPYECAPGRDFFCNLVAGGRCLRASDGNGYCAYPASDCPLMLRWAERAAEPYANQCVDPAFIPMDGGLDGATTDGASDAATDGGG